MDLATLGLAVDSSGVRQAISDLKDFSGAGNQASQAAARVSDSLGRAKGPAAEFAKNFAEADAQQANYSKSANKVIDNLANQYVRINATAKQWAQLSAVQRAGVPVNSDAADKISKMAGALYDLEDAQKKVANDNSRMAKILGGSQVVAALGLFGIGFSQVFAAAKQLYDYLEIEGPKTETLLKEQDRLIRVVRGSYDEATKSAKNFYEQSKDVTQLQLLQSQIDLQSKLNDEVGKTISNSTRYDNIGGFLTTMIGGAGERVVKEQLQPFEDALFKLYNGFKEGAPNVREFVDEVARIGKHDPALQKMAVDLIKSAGNASELAQKLNQIKSALKLLEGGGLDNNDRHNLGIRADRSAESLAKQWDRQLASLSKRNAAMEAEARSVGLSDAAHEKMRTTLLLEDFLYSKGIKNIDAYRSQIEKAGDEAAKTAEKLARARIVDKINFDRDTAFLSPEDVQIAQQLRGLYPDVATALGSVYAQEIRSVNAMRQMHDAAKSFADDFLSGLRQGKSLLDSLLGAASNFATKLANMGLDKMMSGLTGGGDFSKVFGGDLGSAIGKGVKQSLDDIELKSRNAATNPANGFMFNGSGGVGKGLAGIAAGLGIYAQGQQIGASGGSATTGALSGALSGALAGSALLPGIGTAIGAVVGGIAGLLGASDGAKKAAQQAKDDWANAKTAADLFGKQLAGSGQGSLTTALAQAKSQTEQYTIMAQKAKDQDSSDRLGQQYNQYYKRMTEAFRDSFGGIVDAFNSGLGPNSPFATGAKSVKDIGDELKGFIEDTKTAMDYLAPGASGSAVAQATAAAQKYMLSLLGQAPVLTETQTAIQHLSGTAAQLQTTLVELGMSSQDAADAINAGVLASMKQLADTFANGIQREINAASGQDYLNSISDLVAKFQSNLADAAALGLGPDLVNKWFKVSAQKIVDDAGLAGSAIADLIAKFPQLAGVVTATSQQLQAIYDAATNSVSVAQAAVDEARSNLEKAYQTEASRLNEVISRTQAFIKSIQQFKDSLVLDQNLSPLDPYQRLQEAQKQFQQTSVLALSGNQDAMDRVQDVSRSYLEEAKAYYGSSAQYFDIFSAVNSVLDSALTTANSQLTAEQQSLALLNQQVDGLITVNDSVLSVADAVAAQTAAQSALAQAVLAQSQAATNLINANPNAATGNVDLLYQSILGRQADAAGKAYWQSQIAAGMSGQDLIKAFIGGAQGSDATAAAAYAAKYGYQNGGIVGSYAAGGIVGNGIIGVDSVLARFAGGGYIGLAGGEGILTASATQRLGGASAISAINAGRYAANDTGWRDVVAALKSEMGALRQQNAELTQRLIAVTGAGAQMNVDATRENTGAVRQQAGAARQAKYQRAA